ncbi:PREDICTED: RNA polymerase I-specific transcription initiation factor RRN3 [Camelina sativa]|uniref:RNA polymerase I-specific transcription initiation factor RRN3 n=1 Tax=Camelina sativa TaxID=90675 RepID=A0ABM1RTX3_CAMSA|nr:PREDICTED: RNA polymerase I-specific transcription initiation factor RRN3 [Camelina sativa]XP_010516633.1 PREDICTED: RNA polymerase I-specific transcription initiation factor RRN3 [Camelina sativa]XP_010516634.1 PREDICTED: RNA polymerase I-specific transcription initiation factor RRN3 [Camelina sativa]XP_010516635.1 PREDICTED: RNA polymerase I-specific transcription initiation factor RRN3 [Camelina sativa]XP_019102461.1 PREDICTED: RNA polymerase I-specific transcription initiation factor RRN
MGAVEVLNDSSSLYASDLVENVDLSDMNLVQTLRKALTSVQTGDSDLYNEIVEVMSRDVKDFRADFDAVAQLETVLKALSCSVSCIDIVHHYKLLSALFGMKLWDHNPNVMDALVNLVISLAVTSGKYLDSCLNMLIKNFLPPPWVIKNLSNPRILNKKTEVFARVHAAFLKISILVPLTPSRLVPMLSQNMPKIHRKDLLMVIYVENLLKLENSSIGRVGGSVILNVVMERLRDLDVEIGWDDIPQDDSRGMFDMELEDAVEGTIDEGDEFPVGPLSQDTSGGSIVVSELLDKLMVIAFEHLESCQNDGRLDEVFELLFQSFENFVLDTYKSKFSQFLMFYACSLDPENCGVKFASKLMDIFLSSRKSPATRRSAVAYLASFLARGKFLPVSFVASMLKRLMDECVGYCRTCNGDIRPEAHLIFFSGCQAIMYVLCFRMRSILDVPRLRSELTPLESILTHKLDPLSVCIPSVVAEFLRQAKADGLFIVSDSFIFNNQLESELSGSFGGCDKLKTFFPFDPCLLKSSNSFISPNFIYWSMVRAPYDEDEEDDFDAEVIVNGDEDSEEGEDEDVDYAMNKMSITPKHSFKNQMMERDRLLRMPSRIRPSTSPESL